MLPTGGMTKGVGMDHRSVRTTTGDDGSLCLVLQGDIDFTNASAVRQVIEQAVGERRPSAVRVDLAEVPFLDSSGIEVLVVAHRLAESAGVDCTIERPSRAVFEHLRLIGLADLFGITAPQTDG
jgi:anti-sigma B factor antagonist